MGHLYQTLREKVPDACYVQGKRVTDVRSRSGGAELEIDGRDAESFDVVVFADGHNSIGRGFVSPGSNPLYQGYFLWRGVLPERMVDAAIFHETLQRVGYPGGHFFAYLLPNANGSMAVGDRELNWGMFLPKTEDELQNLLMDRYGDRHALSLPPGSVRDDVEQALKAHAVQLLPAPLDAVVRESANTFGQAIVAASPRCYHKGRLCLVGDAGAVVPPFTTSGVLKGMNNALSLIEAIGSGESIDQALVTWDERQQAHAAGLNRLSELMAQKLITAVPDFSTLDQDGLDRWWKDVQDLLQEVMA